MESPPASAVTASRLDVFKSRVMEALQAVFLSALYILAQLTGFYQDIDEFLC